MILKKFLLLLIISSMLLSLCTTFVYAEETKPLTLKLSNASCKMGDTANIDFTIDNVPSTGLHGFVVFIDYDKTKLEFKGLEGGPILYNKSEDTAYSATTAGVKIMYCDTQDTGTSGLSSNGLLCNLKFKALGDKESIPLFLHPSNTLYDDKDNISPLNKAVYINGAVNISLLYGDANNDSIVDPLDYYILNGLIIGKISPDKNDKSFIYRMDLNGDSEIDSSDYALLRRFLLKMIPEFPVSPK